MLYLSGNDILESIGLDEIMGAIELAYAIDLSGEYDMPARTHIHNANNTILYMPCFLKNIFGTKILTLFPGNVNKNKAVIDGLVLLNDAETGSPLAILDGAIITALRTGAVGGVAVRYIAPEKAKSVGIVGAGVQGYYQAVFAARARKIEMISAYDLSDNKLDTYCNRLKQDLPGITVTKAKSIEHLLSASEIIITATPANQPVLPDDEEMLYGKSYIGIGSYRPDMREFPKALYRLVDNVFIDSEHGLEETGDLITPLKNKWIEQDKIVKIGSYIKMKNKKTDQKATTLFKSVGMALFDIVVAERIYLNALEKNIGAIL